MARSTNSRRRYAGFGSNGRTEFYHHSLGKTFLDYEHEVVLQIGDDAWTRAELARDLGCCHLAAARRLSHNLELHDITSVNKLHATPPEELMAMAGVGTIQLFVAMCVLDARKFDAEQWYGHDADTVTATTLQARAKKALEGTSAKGRRRSSARSQ